MDKISGTVKNYTKQMSNSAQNKQVKAPEIRIGGHVKFYDKQKDFGFISADHGQDYYFRMSDLRQRIKNGLTPQTKVTFVPKANKNKNKQNFATEILIIDHNNPSLPPPCPHCGAMKGSHFGWIGEYGTKIYLCNSCGKEHIYGDMLKYNYEVMEAGIKNEEDGRIIMKRFKIIFFTILALFIFLFIKDH